MSLRQLNGAGTVTAESSKWSLRKCHFPSHRILLYLRLVSAKRVHQGVLTVLAPRKDKLATLSVLAEVVVIILFKFILFV